MIADVALRRRPVGLGVDRRCRKRVGHVGGSIHLEIAVVVVDGHQRRHVELFGEREQHRFVLVVVDEVGLRLVVAQRDPRDDRRPRVVPAGLPPTAGSHGAATSTYRTAIPVATAGITVDAVSDVGGAVASVTHPSPLHSWRSCPLDRPALAVGMSNRDAGDLVAWSSGRGGSTSPSGW